MTRTELARRRQQMNRRIRELVAVRRADRFTAAPDGTTARPEVGGPPTDRS